MEPKITLLLAKIRKRFLNCHLINFGTPALGIVPLLSFLIRWKFRNLFLVLAISNVTFGSMIVYGIRLSPNNYVLVMCFGMPFQKVCGFSQKNYSYCLHYFPFPFCIFFLGYRYNTTL